MQSSPRADVLIWGKIGIAALQGQWMLLTGTYRSVTESPATRSLMTSEVSIGSRKQGWMSRTTELTALWISINQNLHQQTHSDIDNMEQQYSIQSPSDESVQPHIIQFIQSFFSVSDTPGETAKYVDMFTPEATFVVASKKASGHAGNYLPSPVHPLRTNLCRNYNP